MKKFGMKSVVAAVGALAALSAQAAAVNLDAASPVAVTYASEVNTTTAVTLKGDGAVGNADLKASTALGASFGLGAVAYVRFDLTNAQWGTAPTAADLTTSNANGTVALAQTGVSPSGKPFVIFALGTTGGAATLLQTDVLTFNLHTPGLQTANKNGVSVQYRLFETLTAAANETNGTSLKSVTAQVAKFGPTLAATVDTLGQRVSDVNATPSFSAFTTTTANTPFAKIKVAVNPTFDPLSVDGAPVAAGGLLTNTNSITVSGDFTFITGGTGGTAGVVRLDQAQLATTVCDTTGTQTPATTVTATTATFSNISATDITNTDGWFLCATARTAATAYPEILPTQFTSAVNLVEQTGYTVADVAGAASGSIVTNGATLIAPLTNHPDGWLSRLVLVNTGAQPRAYTLSYITEAGTTVAATGEGVSGTIPANTTLVIPLQDPNMAGSPALTTTAGKKRASVKAVVNAPLTEITGSYQIVNATGSSISNQTMVAK